MKKIYGFVAILLWIISMIVILPQNVYWQEVVPTSQNSQNSQYSVFNNDSTDVLHYFYYEANKKSSDRVQNTELDYVNSNSCRELGVDSRFTISRTLCYIKENIGDYLQYIMYVGLSAAVIFLIWNGFQLVTASDREKQMSAFKKNLIYIIIWVILLVSFYFIINIFVSFVNLIAE